MIATRSPDAASPPFRGPKRVGVLDTLRYLGDPRAALERAAQQWGDPFVMPYAQTSVVVTGHPEALRAVFTADPDVFAIPMRARLEPFFGPTSLMMTTGERHRHDRKLLSPCFHGARMRAYGHIIRESAQQAARRWVRGKPFAVLDTARSITLDVITRAIFGVESGPRRRQFHDAFAALMAAMSSPVLPVFTFVRRDFGGFGPWARFLRTRARFEALVAEELAARRASATTAAREDVLSLMMSARYDDGSAMSDVELRDQLHLLLFGGHDTTSIALAWALYWLHRRPEVRARVLAEIDALGPDPEPDALVALPYLDAVCHETLRLHPIALNVARLLQRPLDVMGRTLPPGTAILASVVLLHARDELYPEPRRFDPDRFLQRKFSPFEFIAFGGGARRCIGMAFALYEMKIVLATLLRGYRLRLASSAPVKEVLRGLSLAPRGGVAMIYDGPT
jgi:cytochrome P450